MQTVCFLNTAQALQSQGWGAVQKNQTGIQIPAGNLLAVPSYLISLRLSLAICEMRIVLSTSPRLLENKVRDRRGHHTA